MAGESADEVARAAREKAERLLRRGEAYARGAAGERATAAVLATLPETWTVLHDLRWPGRQRANIDHVAIGPTGVFVIDSKNWAGTITLTGEVLRQNGYSRGPALSGAADAAAAVASLVPSLRAAAFTPVLCLVRDEPILETAAGVTVCTTATLVAALTGRPAVLGAAWLDFLRFELDMSTRSAGDPSVSLLAAPSPATALPPRHSTPAGSAVPDRAKRARPGRARRAPTRRRRRRKDGNLVSALLGLTMLAAALFGFEHHLHQTTPAKAPHATKHHAARQHAEHQAGRRHAAAPARQGRR